MPIKIIIKLIKLIKLMKINENYNHNPKKLSDKPSTIPALSLITLTF